MKPTTKRQSRRKLIGWTLLAMLLAVAVAPFSGLLLTDPALAQTESAAPAGDNPRSNFWRAVREGNDGYTAVQGPETGVLIQNGGENWRMLREGPVFEYGMYILLGMLALIVLFYILFGRVKLDGGREFMTVERWSLFDRTLHWFTASLFIVLAITGLSLLYGRYVLIPYIGKDAFAAYAAVAKDLHNYLGPFFAVGLVIELLKWMRHNVPKWVDIVWLLKGGGVIGRAHPSAERMNGGEKIWYWLLFFVGLVLVASGLVLNFPIFGQTRADMQLAQLIHVATAFVLMAVAMGHIYIGTLGTEGSVEGMVTGRVDTRWAKQHHDIWYQQLLEKGVKPVPTPQSGQDRQPTGSRTPATG